MALDAICDALGVPRAAPAVASEEAASVVVADTVDMERIAAVNSARWAASRAAAEASGEGWEAPGDEKLN